MPLSAPLELELHLARRKIPDLSGWRCLEVGGSGGSIATWLAARVVPSGHVLVTDIEPRFLDSLKLPSTEVRRHNVATDPLPESAFDLVHARLVPVHLPEREKVAGGKVLALEVKLDKPLPPESTVFARVRPESVSQLILMSSATSDDSTRTKITVKATLPNVVVPGKWRLEDIFISLPGTNIWQPLEHNQLTFDVQGKQFPIPQKAEVSVAK